MENYTKLIQNAREETNEIMKSIHALKNKKEEVVRYLDEHYNQYTQRELIEAMQYQFLEDNPFYDEEVSDCTDFAYRDLEEVKDEISTNAMDSSSTFEFLGLDENELQRWVSRDWGTEMWDEACYQVTGEYALDGDAEYEHYDEIEKKYDELWDAQRSTIEESVDKINESSLEYIGVTPKFSDVYCDAIYVKDEIEQQIAQDIETLEEVIYGPSDAYNYVAEICDCTHAYYENPMERITEQLNRWEKETQRFLDALSELENKLPNYAREIKEEADNYLVYYPLPDLLN